MAAGHTPAYLVRVLSKGRCSYRQRLTTNGLLNFRAHVREQNHIAYARGIRQQHHQPVDADAFPGGGRQAVFQRAHEIVVLEHRFLIAGLFCRDLRIETRGLVFSIVQFREAVGDLASDDEQLEALGDLRVLVAAARQR